jgi:hypothetical protein
MKNTSIRESSPKDKDRKEEITIEMAENIGLINKEYRGLITERGKVFIERETILEAVKEQMKPSRISLEDRIYELCRKWINVIKI